MKEPQEIVPVSVYDLKPAANAIDRYREISKTASLLLRNDEDYGKIPGTAKPSLWQSGAQKINAAYRVRPEYEVLASSIRDHLTPYYHFDVVCRLYHQALLVGEGIGSCNSKEKQFRYRWLKPEEVRSLPEYSHLNMKSLPQKTTRYGATLFRVDNAEVHDQVNTLLKMAKKRAYVDATLSTYGLGSNFTQDLGDYVDDYDPEEDWEDPPKQVVKAGPKLGSSKEVVNKAFQAWEKSLAEGHNIATLKETVTTLINDKYACEYWDISDDMVPELYEFLRGEVKAQLIEKNIIEKEVE